MFVLRIGTDIFRGPGTQTFLYGALLSTAVMQVDQPQPWAGNEGTAVNPVSDFSVRTDKVIAGSELTTYAQILFVSICC